MDKINSDPEANEKRKISETSIKVEDLSFKYTEDEDWVVKNLDLKINQGDFIGIVGPSGSGKSTFALTLNGVIPHMIEGNLKGNIYISGERVRDSKVHELVEKIGIILQDPESQLFCMTVEEEVTFGVEELGLDPEIIKKRLDWALEVVDLEGMENEFPEDLSGGEKQRLAIASSLAMKPEILILDEPTSQIDPKGTKEVLSVIQELNDQGITIILIEHQTDFLAKFSDKILAMKNGEAKFFGPTRDFFRDKDLVDNLEIRVPTSVEISYRLGSDIFLSSEELLDKFGRDGYR